MVKTAPCPRCKGEVPLPDNGSEIVNCPSCHARLAKNPRGFVLLVCEVLVGVIPWFGFVTGYTGQQMRRLAMAAGLAAAIAAMAEVGRSKLRIVDETPAEVTLAQSTTEGPSQPVSGELQPASHFSIFRRRIPFGR